MGVLAEAEALFEGGVWVTVESGGHSTVSVRLITASYCAYMYSEA